MDRSRPPDIIVIAGGSPATRPALDRQRRPLVVAADSGVAIASAWGVPVDVAVGDFDSLDPALVARLDTSVGEVRRFDAAKDETDLALAFAVAVDAAPGGADPPRLVVAALEGGRIDHALNNFALVTGPATAALEVEVALDHGCGWAVRDELTGHWDQGELLTLIPMHGDAVVSIAGTRWPLDHAALSAGSSLGVSNVAVGGPVAVHVHAGVVLVITVNP